MGTTLKDHSGKPGLMPDPSPAVEIQNGIPVRTHEPGGAVAITGEMVRNLADHE